MASPLPHDLPLTRSLLAEGIARGESLGAQLYLSSGASQSTHPAHLELSLGESQPGVAMADDTLNIWLSSTKPLTAVLWALCWQRDLVGLDTRVAQVIPEFGVQGKEAITFRHILTHTGGFRLLSFGWPEASFHDIVQKISAARQEPRWIPGQKAGYHMASSFFILGEAIVRLLGRDFPTLAREELLLPLGMSDSYIGMPAEQVTAYGTRIGRIFGTEGGNLLPRNWHRGAHISGCSPGGNGYGPMRQLGLFYEMLLRDGRTQTGQRLLTPQTVAAMTARHRVGMVDLTFQTPLDMGLGFILNSAHYQAERLPYGYGRLASRNTFGHSGHQSSTAFADPEHDLVVALLVNGQPGEPRHTDRFRALLEAIYQDLGFSPVQRD